MICIHFCNGILYDNNDRSYSSDTPICIRVYIQVSIGFCTYQTNTMAVAEGQFVGRHVRKIFEGHGMFEGVVLAYNFKERLYNIGYTDGDSEEMTHAEVLDTIISQEVQLNLDGNVVALLSIRNDYDRLKRMSATKVRALGEIIEYRKRQKTSHISSECLHKTDS